MPTSPKAPARSPLSTRKKLVFSLVTCSLFAIVVEAVCAGLGFRPDIPTDPYVGFSASVPLLRHVVDEQGNEILVTAPEKEVWFNHQSFPRVKPPGLQRIFCLGGSTTFGHPFNDATSYSGYLRSLLPKLNPPTEYEVLNFGGISYASYRVATVMEELAAYDPDLFIVYSAHNEFLERRTYASLFDRPQWQIRLEGILRRSHTWNAMDSLVGVFRMSNVSGENVLSAEVDERLNHTPGPIDYVRDDVWTAGVLRHYEFNLRRMVEIARRSGAEILFVEPACNAKDCAPFKADEPHYHDGRRLFELGDFADAEIAFQTAIDRDVCPLRATTAISETVRRVALESRVPLVPLASKLKHDCQQTLGHQCLGEEYFIDHVHPTIAVHGQLAMWIIETLGQSGWLQKQSLTPEIFASVDKEIREAIKPHDHGVAFRNLAKVLHWSGKFEEASRRAEDALRLIPDDPESRFVLADSLSRIGQLDQAIAEYDQLFSIVDYDRAIMPFAELLVYCQQWRKAEPYLTLATAAEKPSTRKRAFELLVKIHEHLGEPELAAEAAAELARLN